MKNNMAVEEVDSSREYDWSADIRQASVLFVAQCRSLYLKNTPPTPSSSSSSSLAKSDTNVMSSFAVFEEGCVAVMRQELASKPSPERLHYIFHTISYLLQPFSASANTAQTSAGEDSWSSLDNQLLSILLECIISSTQECSSMTIPSSPDALQTFALEALVQCLPKSAPVAIAAVADKPPSQQNHIVTSLVSAVDGGATNLQKLLEFAIGPRYIT